MRTTWSFRSFCTIGLVVLGVLQPVTFLFGAYDVAFFARATTASPLPIPFGDSNGYEHFSAKKELILTTTQGEEVIINTKSFLNDIHGVHKRKIVFMTTFSHVSIWPKQVTYPILQYLLCTDAVVASALYAQDERAYFTIKTTQQARGREDWEVESRITCQ